MADLVIRRGTIIDGTGQPGFVGDVAVDGDRITTVGTVSERGRREIDAEGLLVAPGWVDVHTHYDGQVTWDQVLAPSSLHGVTSIVMGNCGVGFAPARRGQEEHDFLIALMEGVEDIPGTALHEGLSWDWESLPEYLDAIDRPYAIDVGAQVPHAALRAYVMGARGADHSEDPTPEEIGEMARLAAEALDAGALGFATSRTVNHRSRTGQKIGSLTARSEELLGIAEALRATGKGVLQFVSDLRDLDYELGLMKAAAQLAGRPLSLSLAQTNIAPDQWREALAWMAHAQADGVDMKAQVPVRGIGLLIGLEGSLHPFVKCPSYQPLADLALAERVARMRDPELRRRLIDESLSVRNPFLPMADGAAETLFHLGDPPNYEPVADQSVAAEARRLGIDANELVYDLLLDREGTAMLYRPALNYSAGNLDATREMLLSELTIPGLSDGGAHASIICDASFPTFLLTHWARDRTRGERLPVEFVIRRQTSDTARHIGWLDRGVVAPGLLADLNVIDFDGLTLRAPVMVHDLPAGSKRLMQRAEGYRYTVKSGQVTFEDGEHTGALPGRLVRGAQPA